MVYSRSVISMYFYTEMFNEKALNASICFYFIYFSRIAKLPHLKNINYFSRASHAGESNDFA